MNPFHALQALVSRQSQARPLQVSPHDNFQRQVFNQGADVTYNPNPRTNIPNSVHSMRKAQAMSGHAMQTIPRGNLGVGIGRQPQLQSFNPGAVPMQQGMNPQLRAFNSPAPQTYDPQNNQQSWNNY